MDGEVRETCCSTCSHRDVCAHKEDGKSCEKLIAEKVYGAFLHSSYR